MGPQPIFAFSSSLNHSLEVFRFVTSFSTLVTCSLFDTLDAFVLKRSSSSNLVSPANSQKRSNVGSFPIDNTM